MTVRTHIGIHAWEQKITQTLKLDIIIPLDLSHCNDKLEHTVDYDALCQTVTTYIESRSYALIETVAEEVTELIKEKFAVQQVTIKVCKPHALKNANVWVTINR